MKEDKDEPTLLELLATFPSAAEARATCLSEEIQTMHIRALMMDIKNAIRTGRTHVQTADRAITAESLLIFVNKGYTVGPGEFPYSSESFMISWKK